MAGLNVVEVQDIIGAYIRQEFPNYEVYDDIVLDDQALLKVSNKVKPYIVLRWGGLVGSGQNKSFAGVRYDEYVSTVDINVIAPTPNQTRKAINIIFDKLIGWKPTGGGALTPQGGSAGFVIPGPDGTPHLYISSARLVFAVNSENVGSYITP